MDQLQTIEKLATMYFTMAEVLQHQHMIIPT